MASFKCVAVSNTADKDETQHSLTPLMECKEAFEYTIPSPSVISVDVQRVCCQAIFEDASTTVSDSFIQDSKELNVQIFPTRIPKVPCLSCVGKEKVFSYRDFVLCTVNSRLLLEVTLGLLLFPRGQPWRVEPRSHVALKQLSAITASSSQQKLTG